MAPGVDSLAKTPGKKVKKKQHRSQSFHQRPEPDNAKSPSVTAAEPRSGNSPPVLSKTVAASQEKPRSKGLSLFFFFFSQLIEHWIPKIIINEFSWHGIMVSSK